MWTSGVEPGNAQEARHECRRRRAIDIVVAEDRDGFAAHHRIGDAPRRHRHSGKHVGVRHQPLDGGIEIGLDLIDLDIAPGDDAGQQFRQAVALPDRHRARTAAVIEPVAPGTPGRGALDTEEMAIGLPIV